MEYQQLPGADQLVWYTHRWEVWYEDDFPNGWPKSLLRLPHRYDDTDGRKFLIVQTGWQWVGMLPETAYPSAPP